MQDISTQEGQKRGQKSTIRAKKAAFCREYVKDYNAAQAYIRAGYAKRGARQGAGRLLTRVDVKAEIARLEKELRKKHELTREWVIAKLQENVARAAQEVPVLDNKGNPTGEYRYEANAVNKGLELLGKIINAFEAHQHAGAAMVVVPSESKERDEALLAHFGGHEDGK